MLINTGIYCIRNIVNNKRYVGQAVSDRGFNRRWSEEQRDLRDGKNLPNKHLQSAWNKYGEENFSFIIIEEIVPEQLLIREQIWIDKIGLSGYNICPNAGSNRGSKRSRESVKSLIKALKGVPKTKEHRENISKAMKGRKQSKEHIENHRFSLIKGGKVRGEKAPAAKLSYRKADEIREKYAEGISSRALGRMYGVHKTTILNIVHRRTWNGEQG